MGSFRYGNKEGCRLELREYSYNGRLCILMRNALGEPEGYLTVNLPWLPAREDEAYLDVNNIPEAQELVERLGIGMDTGFRGKSGYCEYPLYRIDRRKAEEYEWMP